MTAPRPHDYTPRPGGLCYCCLKGRLGLLEVAGIYAGGSLSAEQRSFVGLLGTPEPSDGWYAPNADPVYPPTPLELRREWAREDTPLLRYMLEARTAQRIADRG